MGAWPRLVLATRSAGKLRELHPVLAAAGFEAETLDELGVPESSAEDQLERFDTFVENAQAKARYFARQLPGRMVVAEDSGLVVDALGGRPGVRSKRWSGAVGPDGRPLHGVALDAANNAQLLAELQAAEARAGVTDRSASYVCAAVCVWASGELVREGRCHGAITLEPRGAGGFGYDPYFVSAELGGVTFAEASAEAKVSVSHRGRAFRALLRALAKGVR